MLKKYIFILFLLNLTLSFSQTNNVRSNYLDSIFEIIFINDEKDAYKDNYYLYDIILDTIPHMDNIDKHYYYGLTYSELSISFDPIKEKKKVFQNLNRAKYHNTFGEYPDLDFYINFNEAQIYNYNKEHDKAINLYKRALKYSYKTNLKEHKNLALSFVIGYNLFVNKEDSAKKYLKDLEILSNETSDSLVKSNMLFYKALYYMKYYKIKAEPYFKKALKNCPQYLLKKRKEILGDYIYFLETEKRYKEAFGLAEEYNFYLEEQLRNNFNSHSEILLKNEEKYKAKYKLQKSEIKNLKLEEESKRQNQINIFIVVLFVLIFLVSLVLLSNFKKQKKLSEELKNKNIALNKARIKAEELAQLKSEFSETISHELRTPLHGIIGLTSILITEERNRLTENGKKYLDSLKFSSDYLLKLVNDALQIIKIDAKEVVLDKAPFDIFNLIDNLQNTFDSLKERNKNSFEIKMDKNIPKILEGDSIRFSQILINLIGNALKFTKNGKVFLEIKVVEKTKSKVKLYIGVQDTGKGIPPEKLDDIFEKFSQIKNSSSNLHGTGLGLSIVKELLFLFKSKINVTSKEGEGSLFSFEIDFLCINNGEDYVLEDSTNKISAVNKDRRILLVDDNDINKIVSTKILEMNNYLVDTCSNGEEAVEMLKQNKNYNLVLMDYHMPKMNGYDAVKIIRKFNTETPIILLTASDLSDDWKDFVHIGFDDFIIKPFDKLYFLQKIYKYTK